MTFGMEKKELVSMEAQLLRTKVTWLGRESSSMRIF